MIQNLYPLSLIKIQAMNCLKLVDRRRLRQLLPNLSLQNIEHDDNQAAIRDAWHEVKDCVSLQEYRTYVYVQVWIMELGSFAEEKETVTPLEMACSLGITKEYHARFEQLVKARIAFLQDKFVPNLIR